MNCTYCGTPIPTNERFCRNCGREAVSLEETIRAPMPTVPYTPVQPEPPPTIRAVDPSAKTEYINFPAQPTSEMQRPATTASTERRKPWLIPLVVVSVLLVAGGIVAAIYFLRNSDEESVAATGALPDHFGLFIKSGDTLNELVRRDFSNALEGRDALAGESSLPQAEAQPTLILYAEYQDMPISDLKLVELGSLNQNGQVRYWSYQAAPIEGRRGMKQLRVAGGLPAGRYAFAMINGYINEGNHRFWPFEVKQGASEPGQSQIATIPVKANPQSTPQTKQVNQTTPTPAATPNNDPPPGSRLAYCNDTNVFVRSSPDLNARVVTKITKNQKLWAIGKSTNTSTWKGVTSDWTEVQLYNSKVRGWVFSTFISY